MPSGSLKKRVAFSVINCICFDQRVQKIAETVSTLDCDILIVGRTLGECCKKKLVPFPVKRFRMLFRRGFFFYQFFSIRLFFYLLFCKCDLLVANDLDTLLPNFFVSKIRGIPLVFDSHEYFTGLPEIRDKPFIKRIWTTIERLILPRLKYVMTVTDSISAAFEEKYGIKAAVVRNCSRKSGLIQGFPKNELGISKDRFLLIFQGGGINMDKGGEELIEAVKMTEGVYLIIAGSGEVMPTLKRKVSELYLEDRIKFFPKMPWKDLMRYTKSADAGLSLEKDTNLNYRYSLPNKLFDYISAGIPVISGNLPEIKKVVEATGCGIIIPEITPEEISRAIVKLRDNPDLLNKFRQSSVIASESLNWENESKKVHDFYKQIIINTSDRNIV